MKKRIETRVKELKNRLERFGVKATEYQKKEQHKEAHACFGVRLVTEVEIEFLESLLKSK